MTSIKGILAAAATATALSGAPAAAQSIDIHIDLGGGNSIGTNGITLNLGGAKGSFNIGGQNFTTRNDPNGTNCRNAAADAYNNSSRTDAQYARYTQRMDACTRLSQ